jgi:hypothetical protein
VTGIENLDRRPLKVIGGGGFVRFYDLWLLHGCDYCHIINNRTMYTPTSIGFNVLVDGRRVAFDGRFTAVRYY